MKISILGLGWFGSKLGEILLKEGHEVRGTTRTLEKKRIFEENGLQVELLTTDRLPHQISDADIVVLNIPPFEGQLEWFKRWNWSKNSWIIFISSTSVYPSPDSRSGEILQEEENWIQSVFEKWTIVRFGGLLGEDRHPGKYLSGRQNLQGKNWPVNLIHLDDCIGVTRAIIQKDIKKKIINAIADDHPTREEFYTDYCRKKQLPLPQFDQNDQSIGKLVHNHDMRTVYTPKVSLMNLKD